jgi:voltage-gated potassium channel
MNNHLSLKNKIAFYLEDFQTNIGIIINLSLLGLILISLIIFVAETYPLTSEIKILLRRVDLFVLSIFALEYLIRFWCAEDKISFFLNSIL